MRAIYIGYVAAWLWVLLPALYWATAPEWYRTRTGRALMWLLGSTAALFLLLLTGRTFGEYAGKEIVQGIIYSAVLGAGIRLAVLFFQLRLDLNRVVTKGPVRGEWLHNLARKMRRRSAK